MTLITSKGYSKFKYNANPLIFEKKKREHKIKDFTK